MTLVRRILTDFERNKCETLFMTVLVRKVGGQNLTFAIILDQKTIVVTKLKL